MPVWLCIFEINASTKNLPCRGITCTLALHILILDIEDNKQRQNRRHKLKEELKVIEFEEAVHKGEHKQGEIHGEDNVDG